MTLDKMTVDQSTLDKMTLDQNNLDKMTLDQMTLDIMTLDKMTSANAIPDPDQEVGGFHDSHFLQKKKRFQDWEDEGWTQCFKTFYCRHL